MLYEIENFALQRYRKRYFLKYQNTKNFKLYP